MLRSIRNQLGREEEVMQPEVVIPVQCSDKAAHSEPEWPTSAEPEPPVHPYAEACDATYAVPHNRNFGVAPKPGVQKKAEPAYRTLPPVYDGKIARMSMITRWRCQ